MCNSYDDQIEGGASMYSQMLDAFTAGGGGFMKFPIKLRQMVF